MLLKPTFLSFNSKYNNVVLKRPSNNFSRVEWVKTANLCAKRYFSWCDLNATPIYNSRFSTNSSFIESYQAIFPKKLYSSVQFNEPPSTPDKFNEILNNRVESGKDQEGELILKEMKQLGVAPNHETYLALFKGSIVTEKFDKLDQYLEMMVHESKIPVNISTINHIISTCCDTMMLSKAEEIYQRLENEYQVKANIDTFRPLMNFCFLYDEYEKAEKYFQTMIDGGIQPTQEIMETIIENCGEHLERVDRYLKMMIETYNFTPSSSLFHNLIAVSHNDKLKKKEYLQLMHDLNVPPTIEICNLLISQSQDTKSAKEQLNAIQSKYALQPNLDSYTALVNTAIKCDDDQSKVDEFINEMESKGLIPTINTYNSFINTCITKFDLEEAERFMKMMKSKDIQPNSATYNTFINYGYNTIDPNCVHIAEYYYSQMLENQVKPNPTTFASLIHVCSQNEQSDKAHSYLQSISKFGISEKDVLLAYATAYNAFIPTVR